MVAPHESPQISDEESLWETDFGLLPFAADGGLLPWFFPTKDNLFPQEPQVFSIGFPNKWGPWGSASRPRGPTWTSTHTEGSQPGEAQAAEWLIPPKVREVYALWANLLPFLKYFIEC